MWSLTARVTGFGPKQRVHSMPSFVTEIIMLLYCRLKVYGMKEEMNFWLTVSTNGELTRLCQTWNDCWLFWHRYGCAWLWLVEKILGNCRKVPLYRSRDSSFLQTTVCHLHQLNILSVLLRKWSIRPIGASVAQFTVVETCKFFGWNVNQISFRHVGHYTSPISSSIDFRVSWKL